MRQALSPALLLLLAHSEPGVFKYNFATENHTFAKGTKPDRINGGVASDKPFFFSVPVPKGTFKVSAFIGDPNATCRTTIKAGSRVMIEHADTEPARTREVSFEIKVQDASVPLTLEFAGARPCLDALEIRPVPIFEPTWDSIRAHYQPPEWFRDAKFGIFLHWGLYSVPAHGSEWYVQHMYNDDPTIQWHTDHFGAPAIFGYKDFIPLFKAQNFHPEQWAELFRKAGAKYVMLTAEHHDGFAMWDSNLTKWNVKQMGPHRDLTGDLAKAVRAEGMKFGVSNHRMEHYSFINPKPGLKTDLDDPEWADFYSVANRSPEAYEKFLADWVARNKELIDKYQPDTLYFDNGVNSRKLDPQKLEVAAYYYNQAAEWKKQVSILTKSDAYLAGSIRDYERQMRAPKTIQADPFEVDDAVGHRWGYLTDDQYMNVGDIVSRLVDNVTRNGNLLLNFGPRADGTFDDTEIALMTGIGKWLDVNGEAIYGTRPWTEAGFTTKGNALYAFLMQWPADKARIDSIKERVSKVEMLGHKGDLKFTQDTAGLTVTMPAEKPCDYAWALRITYAKAARM